MKNVGSNSPTSMRSGRTYWVRSTIAAPPGTDKPPAPKKAAGKRFIEPYRLTDEQRAKLIAPLAAQGIGDAEGRNLFAAAMEYDLAGCRTLGVTGTEQEPPGDASRATSKSDEALMVLATTARAMAEQLATLDGAVGEQLQRRLKETDLFKRDYGGDYLDALRAELERIADITPSAPVQEQLKHPTLTAEAKRFIARAADAFRDCFEQRPTAESDAPFSIALQAVVAATRIPIPTDPQTLAEVFERRP